MRAPIESAARGAGSAPGLDVGQRRAKVAAAAALADGEDGRVLQQHQRVGNFFRLALLRQRLLQVLVVAVLLQVLKY